MKTTLSVIVVIQLFTSLLISQKLFAQHPATAIPSGKNLPQELLKQKQIEFPAQQISQGGLRDIFLETGFRANQWKENSQTWAANDSSTYTYLSDPNHDFQQQISLQWDTASQAWKNNWRYTDFYNANYLVTTHLTEQWNGSQWDSVDRYTYTYNADGNQTSFTNENYNGANVWENVSKSLYQYDSSGNFSIWTEQSWNAGTSAWLNTSQFVYTYTGNLVTERTEYQWNSLTSSWDNYYMTDYIYNNNGVETQYITRSWNAATSSWDNYTKFSGTVDSLNYYTEWLYKIWDDASSQYLNNFKYEFTYDANHNGITFNSYDWIDASQSWLDLTIDSSFFDSNNLRVKEEIQSIDYTDSVLKNADQYFYWYEDVNTAIPEVAGENFSLNLFPNPVKDAVTVSIQSNKTTDAVLQLFDVSGRKMLKMNLHLQTGNNKVLISAVFLKNGAYNVILNDQQNSRAINRILMKE